MTKLIPFWNGTDTSKIREKIRRPFELDDPSPDEIMGPPSIVSAVEMHKRAVIEGNRSLTHFDRPKASSPKSYDEVQKINSAGKSMLTSVGGTACNLGDGNNWKIPRKGCE